MALRACLLVRNYIDVSVHELHLDLNVQLFGKRMQYFLLCSMYRNIENGFLVPIVPRIVTRMHKAPVLPLPSPNTDCFFKSAILYVRIRNSDSLALFKTNINGYLFI